MRWSVVQRAAAVGALALVFVSSEGAAQRNETLLGRRGGTQIGGFGGPVVKLSRVADADAVFSGGRGGVILNRRLVISGGGYSLTTENVRTGFTFPNGESARLGLDYGGIEFEYITRPSRLAHATFYLLLGGGSANYQATRNTGSSTSTQRLESDVFVLEPMVNLELNVTRWFRVGAGAGYRHVNGSDLPRVTDGALSGGVGTLTFKFGSF